jgi:hypothetical protein
MVKIKGDVLSGCLCCFQFEVFHCQVKYSCCATLLPSGPPHSKQNFVFNEVPRITMQLDCKAPRESVCSLLHGSGVLRKHQTPKEAARTRKVPSPKQSVNGGGSYSLDQEGSVLCPAQSPGA